MLAMKKKKKKRKGKSIRFALRLSEEKKKYHTKDLNDKL